MAGGMCSRCRECPTTGTSGFCVECRRAYNREYRARLTPEQRRQYNHRTRTPEQVRARNLKQSFGITLVDYAELAETQFEVCAICFRPPPDGKRLVVDHNHATGAIRSLLCNNCNTLLGMAGDNVEVLRNAIEYLEGWQ